MRKNRLIREITGWKQHSHNMFLSSTALVNEDWSVNGDWTFNGDVQFESEVASTRPISAADPVDADDLVTLGYFNSHAGLYQGVLDASAGIAYPAATEGMFWRISVAGTIGTTLVEVGDQVIAIADYAGGMDDTKFMIVQTNTQITSVTYAQLSTLITDSKLEAGRQYLISDYATVYNIFDGGTNTVIEAQTGSLEQLLVKAIKSDTLDIVAQSWTHPKDIIHYNPLVDAVERAAFIAAGDVGYVTAGSLVAKFKGVIEFRHDTKQNVSTWYDFRNIKFRRWAVDAVAYDAGTAYAAKALCKSGMDNNIYKCITATTGEGDPTVNTADWIVWRDMGLDSYVSWTSDKTKLSGMGDCTSTNLVLNPATYVDVYTFGDYYSQVYNVQIGKNFLTTSYKTRLNNITFNTANTTGTCNNSIINDYCFLFSIGHEFTKNVIHNSSNKNIISNRFSENIALTGFVQNMFGYQSNNNYLESDFNKNVISETLTSTHFKSKIASSNIKDGFSSSVIGNRTKLNVDTNCNRVSIGDYNTQVNIGNDCTGISIGENNGTITLGANCQNLTFKNGCTFTNTNADALINTTFENGSVVNGLDFAAATHIKAAYSKTVFMNATSIARLSYFDAADALTVDDVNH